jgi:hypothetical protein
MAPVSVTGGHRAMDNLPEWAVSIIVIAVGLSPGLALVMARPVGRFLRRVLLERSEVAPQSRREPVPEGPTVVVRQDDAGRCTLPRADLAPILPSRRWLPQGWSKDWAGGATLAKCRHIRGGLPGSLGVERLAYF